MRIAVLGTGIMGAPMARNIRGAGHDVAVWNRTRARAEPLAEDGARVAGSPAEAVHGRDAVVTMLSDGPAVEQTMEDAVAAIQPGTMWLQMSTIGVAATERLARRANARDLLFVDAPVLGSRPQAEKGELVVLASGFEEARPLAQPVFEAVGRRTLWLGAAGAGTRLKLVANSWVLSSIEGLAETFALARRLGVDPRAFLEAIEGGAMDMPYLHVKGESILQDEFPAAFPLRLARKDLALVLEAAGDAELPSLRAALAQFERALKLGHGDEDMAAVYYASARG